MVITGYAQRIEQDISPADIISPEAADSGDPAVLAAHCLERVAPELSERLHEGDCLVVAGQLRVTAADALLVEAAALALQAIGASAVICVSANGLFRDEAERLGLPILVLPAAVAEIGVGHVVRLDLARGTVEDQQTQNRWVGVPCSSATLVAVQRAQLLSRMRRVVEDEGYAE